MNVKINRGETAEKGRRAGEVGTIGNRTFRLAGRPENNGVRDANGFYPWALALSNCRLAAQGTTPTAAQSARAVATIMGVTDVWMRVFLSASPGQPHTNGLSHIVSNGYEVALTCNCTRNWRIEFTGAQQIATDTAIGPEQFNDWQERLPVWTRARSASLPGNGDGRGALYWTTLPVLGGDTPETTCYNGLISPCLISVANVGKPRTPVRKYRWNTVTTTRSPKAASRTSASAVPSAGKTRAPSASTAPQPPPAPAPSAAAASSPIRTARSSIPPAPTSISPPATASSGSTTASVPTSATRSRTAASRPSPAIPTVPSTSGASSSRVASS